MSEIDVSKCELFYNDDRCFGGQINLYLDEHQGVGSSCHKSDYCKYNPNCYYKQLQRANNQIAEDEILQCDMRETIDNLKGQIAGLQSLNDFNIQKIEVLEDKIERINETAHWSMDEVDSGLKNILRNIQEICGD